MGKMSFNEACEMISDHFRGEWEIADEYSRMDLLEKEKRAIMGYEKEIEDFKLRIGKAVKEAGIEDAEFPAWYRSLEDGIFAEVYGLAGLTPWAYDENEEYSRSSSAKLIGERMFTLIDGKIREEPQKIRKERREQLKRAFLMATPRERLEVGFHEVYLRNGIRITIFSGDRTKEDEDVMVFRKYLVDDLSFREMIELGTMPEKAEELFRLMIRIGYNTIFSGPVRSGKTTFLQTWQKYEDPCLEGLAIATDPETDWHRVMPEAPIMQLIADGKELEGITRSILRGDNDYVLLEEMRDPTAYRVFLGILGTGTRRSKATVHTSDPVNLPYKIASDIRGRYGDSLEGTLIQIFTNFHYVFQLSQVEEDRGKKILTGIWEYTYDPETDRAAVHRIMEYDAEQKVWRWHYHMGKDKRKIALLYPEELKKMEEILKALENETPITGETEVYPAYYSGRGDN